MTKINLYSLGAHLLITKVNYMNKIVVLNFVKILFEKILSFKVLI